MHSARANKKVELSYHLSFIFKYGFVLAIKAEGRKQRLKVERLENIFNIVELLWTAGFCSTIKQFCNSDLSYEAMISTNNFNLIKHAFIMFDKLYTDISIK